MKLLYRSFGTYDSFPSLLTATMTDPVLSGLSRVFRQHGYEGASLSLLAEASGLGRASLYHRFPGGKQEMAMTVLDATRSYFVEHVIDPLRSEGHPRTRIRTAVAGLRRFYDNGKAWCLLDILSLGSAGAFFQERISGMVTALFLALKQVSVDGGHDDVTAEERAREALIRIQGALVVSRASGHPEHFARVLDTLDAFLLD